MVMSDLLDTTERIGPRSNRHVRKAGHGGACPTAGCDTSAGDALISRRYGRTRTARGVHSPIAATQLAEIKYLAHLCRTVVASGDTPRGRYPHLHGYGRIRATQRHV